MRFAVLVMTDGRDEILHECLTRNNISANGAVELWLHDDTGDDGHRRALAERYPHVTRIGEGPRRGFGGAIRYAWSQLLERSRAEYIAHWEDDFLAAGVVDLTAMATVLEANPYLVQIALRRQPWNAAERAAGGIIEQHPDDYHQVTDGRHTWLEHRRFFTTNPCLYRRSLMERGWPEGEQSEGHFGLSLFAENPQARAAFWGPRDAPPAVEHIGYERVGTGY